MYLYKCIYNFRYRPDVPLAVVARWLHMEHNDLIEFLKQKGIDTDNQNLDCRKYNNAIKN